MTIYLLALTCLFAFVTGHAVASWWYTREWFYQLAIIVFAASSAILAWVMTH